MGLRRRAQRQVALDYAPQYRALEMTLAEARRALRSGKKAEKRVARAIIQSTKVARPEAKRDYRQVLRAAARADDVLQDVPEDSLFADAIAQEQAGFGRRLQEQKAGELAELRSRAMRAQDARSQNVRGLRGEFAETQAGVQGERQALAADEGQAFLSLLGTLRGERTDRRQARRAHALDVRSQAEEERHNLESEANARAEEARMRRQNRRDRREDEKGGDLTYAQRRDRRADIAQAKAWIEKLQAAGMSEDDAVEVLIRGESIPTKDGEEIDLPDIPAQFIRKAARRGMSFWEKALRG